MNQPSPYVMAPGLADAILARASEPWVPVTSGGVEIASMRLGSILFVIGGSGSGKTSLVAGCAAEHARHHGPAVYATLELDADELAARVVGAHVGASWVDVLQGRVGREQMIAALPDRLAIVDGADNAIGRAEAAITDLRKRFPDGPMLAAVDYIQLGTGGPDVRHQTAAVAESLRAMAKRHRVVVIGVSQTSRTAGKALRAGEVLGAESAVTGAESSAIERAAYLTLAIGAMGQPDDDGVARVEVSIGKSRFGGGDRVLPMGYCGRTGAWHVVGESRPAAEVVAERQSSRDEARVSAARLAMLAAAERSQEPLTGEQLRKAAAASRDVGRRAVEGLIASGDMVQVPPAARSRYPRYRVNPTASRLLPDCDPAAVTLTADCCPAPIGGGQPGSSQTARAAVSAPGQQSGRGEVLT